MKIVKRPDLVKRNKSKKQREICSIANRGMKNARWLGDKVKYSGLHKWLRDNFKKQHKCSFCNKEYLKLTDWANITGIYDRNIKNYKETCRSCHVKLDRWNTLVFKTQPQYGTKTI